MVYIKYLAFLDDVSQICDSSALLLCKTTGLEICSSYQLHVVDKPRLREAECLWVTILVNDGSSISPRKRTLKLRCKAEESDFLK